MCYICVDYLKCRGKTIFEHFKGIDPGKIGQNGDLSFYAENKSLYVGFSSLKCFGPSAIVHPPKTGPNRGNTRTFITFSDYLLLLL